MPKRRRKTNLGNAWDRSVWKECGITGKTVRNAKARAKERGRMVEIWCGSVPMVSVYPDGRLKLSGRGT